MPTASNRSGFSLPELLVVVAVLGIVGVLTARFLAEKSRFEATLEARVTAGRLLDQTVHRLRKDLQVRDDAKTWEKISVRLQPGIRIIRPRTDDRRTLYAIEWQTVCRKGNPREPPMANIDYDAGSCMAIRDCPAGRRPAIRWNLSGAADQRKGLYPSRKYRRNGILAMALCVRRDGNRLLTRLEAAVTGKATDDVTIIAREFDTPRRNTAGVKIIP